MRIAILGNSGSGKSTLAAWLSRVGGAELLDLDTVAWFPGEIAKARPERDAVDDIERFCRSNPRWVVEGCYANLIEATLPFEPVLVFLNPGLQACLDNCRARPWESHKYPSKAEQDERLAFLLAWVAEYYTRDGAMSLREHQATFARYRGRKFELTAQVSYSPPSPSLAAIIDGAA